MSRSSFTRMASAAAAGALAALLVAASPVLADEHDDGGTPGNPPGNNGTIKVDNVPFDDHPDNEPHVSCTFEIDFYNYDEGDLWADVEFVLHAPTGKGIPLEVEPASVFIGEDPAGGSDGGDDLDASQQYDLSDAIAETGEEPHPEQGHHVKLTIHADGSQGADVKHKVFWVEPCGGEVGGGGEETGGETGGNEVQGSVTERNEVLGTVTERNENPAVLGTETARVAGTSLAATGTDSWLLAGVALGLILFGWGLTRQARRTA